VRIEAELLDLNPVAIRLRASDTRFSEVRLLRSVKYGEAYLYTYDTVCATKADLQQYFMSYNQFMPHSLLDGKTPDEFNCENLPTLP